MDKRDGKEGGGVGERKPYRRPRLVRLGTLTQITEQVGSTGKSDTHGTKTSLP
jgi:hypothetical protein